MASTVNYDLRALPEGVIPKVSDVVRFHQERNLFLAGLLTDNDEELEELVDLARKELEARGFGVEVLRESYNTFWLQPSTTELILEVAVRLVRLPPAPPDAGPEHLQASIVGPILQVVLLLGGIVLVVATVKLSSAQLVQIIDSTGDAVADVAETVSLVAVAAVVLGAFWLANKVIR